MQFVNVSFLCVPVHEDTTNSFNKNKLSFNTLLQGSTTISSETYLSFHFLLVCVCSIIGASHDVLMLSTCCSLGSHCCG